MLLRPSVARVGSTLAALIALGSIAGCGYTKEEYQLQGDKLTRALAKQRVAETKADEATAELDSAKARIAGLEDKMRALGIDLEQKEGRIGDLAATLAERERALAEFRARAAKLEESRNRLALLRAKLEELSSIGVEVRIRKNRMIIVLPGDVVFDTNKDKLRKDGRAALKAIADVIKSDPTLSTRDFQVTGHTDSKSLKGGPFGDNLGLSLARARTVMTFLTDAKEGGLGKEHWSAAGYGDTDPIASNDDDEGRKKNRRCELVVMPSVSEILDLQRLALEPKAAVPAKATDKAAVPTKTPEKQPVPKVSPTSP